MEILDLDPADHRLTDWLAQVYAASFPDAERRPLDDLLAGTGDRQVLVACDDGTPRGFAVVVAGTQAHLLEYLAVDPATRGGGVGATLVAAVVERAGALDVLAEVEHPGTDDPADDAVRRESFYRRAGLEPAPWSHDYGMPADGAYLPLRLWHRVGTHPGDPRAAVEEAYRAVYGDDGLPFLPRVLADTHDA